VEIPVHRHRPDLVSLLFGLLFLGIGLASLGGPDGVAGLDAGLVLAALAVVGGLALAAGLLRPRRPVAADASPRALPPAPLLAEVLRDDPLLAPPIDPEELDRRYRATFGEDDPDGAPPAVQDLGRWTANP
jgi:hypothetical protein